MAFLKDTGWTLWAAFCLCVLVWRLSMHLEAGTFPQDFQVLLLLALMFLTLHPLSTKYHKWMAPRI